MNLGFCSRCWNYVDFCDCINYEYDLEFEQEKVIPPPPEEKQPEVGTVWYSRFPIAETALGLESANADKFGLGILLSNENMWTLEPPADPSLYLSIPVNRLPLNTVTSNYRPGGTFNMYLQPWELNWVNYNGPNLDDLKSLAAAIQGCNRRPVGKNVCKWTATIKHFIESFKVDEIPIPPGLTDELNVLTGFVDPVVVLGIILAYFPAEILEKINDATSTAIDYDWVHRHLVDTFDPDLDYRDKNQKYGQAILDGDLLNTQGYYDFPSPSESIASGKSYITTTQANKGSLPDINDLAKERRPWMVCTAKGCKIAKNQNRDKHGKPLPDLKPKPIFDDIIPYDSEDEQGTGPQPIAVNPRPPESSARGSEPIPTRVGGTSPYPLLFHVLSNPGQDQTQFLNKPCVEVSVLPLNDIQTRFVSQTLLESTQFIAISVCPAAGPTDYIRNFTFVRESGTDTQIEYQLGVAPPVVVTASGSTLTIPIGFSKALPSTNVYCYARIKLRGLNGNNTIWRVTENALVGLTSSTTLLRPMNTVKLLPEPTGSYTTEGYLTQFQMVNGTTYVGNEIRCNPHLQIPILLQARNEVNVVSFAPNSFVVPGTFGYAVGRSGGVGGLGSPFLPFDPTSITTTVTYRLNIERSQGQIFVIGILSNIV